MGLIQKLKELTARGEKRKGSSSKSAPKRRGGSAQGSLPGGAGADEAAAANPQRAAELAD